MVPVSEAVRQRKKTGKQVETVFREEHGRILAALISQFEDFDLAEDALQDALVNALERWGIDGIPNNPAAWLITVARRRAIDRLRRSATFEQSLVALDVQISQDEHEMDDAQIPDDRLKLMFTCCHPSLALEAQVALTLHTVGGLKTHEIARAFLVPEATMAQRLARARAKIHNAGIPYRVPPIDLLPERLDALLAVIYLIFNEGYSATSGDEPIRKELCIEAIRLCRVLIALMPTSAEAYGLLALMLLHDSRRETRLDEAGNLALLSQQDRSRWNQSEIREGIQVLEEALALNNPGPYQVQAAISSVHAQANTAEATDWHQIAALYITLMMMTPSLVVEVNRAAAIAMADGPQQGLTLLEGLGDQADRYYPFHVVRADLLRRSGQFEGAIESYERAIALCGNPAERSHLKHQLDSLIQTGK
jgi:RNA polymerase sigma-70 factor (ECF subfamily)